MNTVNLDSIADIVFQLKWESPNVSHMECYAARGVNLWRDWLPQKVREALPGKSAGETAEVTFGDAELFGRRDEPLKIDRRQLALPPLRGRFYPKGRISGLPGIFPQNMTPFRCVEIQNGHLRADMGHPLAGRPLTLSMTIGAIDAKINERGGSSVDWIGMLAEGPGMQARWRDQPTDFFGGEPFARQDPQRDGIFYGAPRLVHHLDQTAREMVSEIYRRFVHDGMRVLDLMSSWVSHLPGGVRPASVSGLSLNRTELDQNPALDDRVVHDLNEKPWLPYPDEIFDTAINTVSIEYLTHPREVFTEVGRVLKPGGTFVVVFSNRWFPTKVVRIWEQLHEFERVGLVTEYFLQSGLFHPLGTYSMRGLPRPRDDRYAGDLLYSDPVYAVWGRKKSAD